MRPFEATIPELKTIRENSFNKFNNSIDWVFSFVKENFNLQNQGLNQLEGTLKDLNNVRREYDLLKPAVLYLKQEGFESKEIIHQEINILEEKIQQIELKKTNQYSELKKVKEIFKSYSDSVNKNSKKKSKPLEILTSHGFMTVNDVTEKIQQIEDETNISEDEINNLSEYNFDHPNAFDFDLLFEHLRDLSNRKIINMPIYNFTTSAREEGTQTIKPANVIIFEGILAFYDLVFVQIIN